MTGRWKGEREEKERRKNEAETEHRVGNGRRERG